MSLGYATRLIQPTVIIHFLFIDHQFSVATSPAAGEKSENKEVRALLLQECTRLGEVGVQEPITTAEGAEKKDPSPPHNSTPTRVPEMGAWR